MAEAKAIAFHEAGHVVVARALGSRIRVVQIEPSPRAICLHRTKANKAITAMAGDLAEQRACPDSGFDAYVDFRVASDTAELLAPSAPFEALDGFRAKAPRTRNSVLSRIGGLAVKSA